MKYFVILFYLFLFFLQNSFAFGLDGSGVEIIQCGEKNKLYSVDYDNFVDRIENSNGAINNFPQGKLGQGFFSQWACLNFNGEYYILIKGDFDYFGYQYFGYAFFSVKNVKLINSGSFSEYLGLLEEKKFKTARKKYPREHKVYMNAKFEKFNFE